MTNIVGISGYRSAGKSTVRNYIVGTKLVEMGSLNEFNINEKGQLVVPTLDNGVLVKSPLALDTPWFLLHDWSKQSMFPGVRNFSFAYELRLFCKNYLGIGEDLLFGPYENKEKLTHLVWGNMPKFGGKAAYFKGKTGQMSVREVLEFFGGMMRSIWEDIWVEKLLKSIDAADTELAVIDDVRMPNELNAIQARGGKVIRLTRQVYEEVLPSEVDLGKDKFDYDKFDYVLDNSGLDIGQTNVLIHKKLNEWGYLNSDVVDEVSV